MLNYFEANKGKYLPRPEHSAWERNVCDKYKSLSTEEIANDVAKNRLPFAFLMTNLAIDYNLGAVVRIANALGGEVFYYGSKKFDRRGAVGTYKYTPVNHLSSIEAIANLKQKYTFVALEQTKNSVSIRDFQWTDSKPYMIMLGSESSGLQDNPEIFTLADYYLEIPMRGSIRSLNVATAASIAAYDFISKRH